ncbi:MAG: hypothetical protein ACE5ID_04245 [Acidobacteriota bacterium]
MSKVQEKWLLVLGLNLRIVADAPFLIAPFLSVFGHFEVSGPSALSRVEIHVDDAAGFYRDGRRTVPLAPGRWRRPHVHNLLYTTLVRSLEGVFLLHAAALEAGGQGLVISAPAGSGKTSLARALVRRQLRFLADDLAPLGGEDGLLHPFPRRLGLDAENVARLMSRQGEVVVGDKHFLPPEALGMNPVTHPLPLGGVVIMNPYQGEKADGQILLTVGLLEPAGRFRTSLDRLAESRIRAVRTVDGLPILEIELAGPQAVAGAMEALAQAEEEILFHCRSYAPGKIYAVRPHLLPISAREAALGLLRETLNREPQSALMRSHGGRTAAVLFHLAGLLEGVPCFSLTPGPLEQTADLLAAAFRRPRPR